MDNLNRRDMRKNTNLYMRAGEYLKQMNEKDQAANILKESTEAKKLYTSAGSIVKNNMNRSKLRQDSLREEIQYNERATLTAMTEMVSDIVENALLLDEAEFAKLNPNYKTEIRETVRGLLENADINKNIFNKNTRIIMEYINEILPDAKTGKYLTEADIQTLINRGKNFNVDEAVKNLSGDVSSKVAKIVNEEQKDIKKSKEKMRKAGVPEEDMPEEEDEDTAVEVDEEGNPIEDESEDGSSVSSEELIDALENGELGEEDIEELLNNGEIDEATYEEVMNAVGEDVEVDADDNPVGENGYGRSIHIDPDGTTSISMPNGELSLNGDGSMDIQLTESFDTRLDNELRRLHEKWSPEKVINKTYRKESGISKSTGLAWLYGGLIGALIARYSGKKIMDRAYSSEIDSLLAYVKKDPTTSKLLKDIQTAVKEHRYRDARLLRKDFADEVELLKAKLRSAKNKAMDDFVNNSDKEIVREELRSRLIESLAVNKAHELLAEGKQYNSDLCIADAIMYVTITEALNISGLVTVTEQDYANIIKSSTVGVSKKTETSAATLNENAYVHWGVLQNKVEPTDMGEKIRQRKLAKQGQAVLAEGSTNLND